MKKYSRQALSFPILMLIGAGVMICSVAVCALIFAIISSLTADPSALTGIFSLLSLLISGAAAAFALVRLMPKGGVAVAIISAAISSALMIIVGLIIGKGGISFGVFLNHLAFLCISALSTLLAKKTVGRKRKYM